MAEQGMRIHDRILLRGLARAIYSCHLHKTIEVIALRRHVRRWTDYYYACHDHIVHLGQWSTDVALDDVSRLELYYDALVLAHHVATRIRP